MYPLCIPTSQQLLTRKKKNFEEIKEKEKRKSQIHSEAHYQSTFQELSARNGPRDQYALYRESSAANTSSVFARTIHTNAWKLPRLCIPRYSVRTRLGTTDRSRVLFTRSLLIVYYNPARRTGEIYPTFPLRLLFSAP